MIRSTSGEVLPVSARAQSVVEAVKTVPPGECTPMVAAPLPSPSAHADVADAEDEEIRGRAVEPGGADGHAPVEVRAVEVRPVALVADQRLLRPEDVPVAQAGPGVDPVVRVLHAEADRHPPVRQVPLAPVAEAHPGERVLRIPHPAWTASAPADGT